MKFDVTRYGPGGIETLTVEAEGGDDAAVKAFKPGNGTASIFAQDASVFTLSLHGQNNFPFRKVASDLDVDLPDGCGDAAYLAALEQ